MLIYDYKPAQFISLIVLQAFCKYNLVVRHLQVIVGTFLLDNKKDASGGVKVDASTNKLPSPVGGASISNIGFLSPVESSGRNPVTGNDDHANIGGNPFMIHPRGMHVAPSRTPDWLSGPDPRVNAGFELTGIIYFSLRNRNWKGGRQINMLCFFQEE